MDRCLRGHKIYGGLAILCYLAHRIAQDRTRNAVLPQNVPSDLELPATGLGTAQLPHPQRWCFTSNVHTSTGSIDIRLGCILQLPELQVC